MHFYSEQISNHCVARLGSDEFVILLEAKMCSSVKALAREIAEQALVFCSNNLGNKYSGLPLSASLGIAMYQSKRAGKNRCSFYSVDE